MAGTRFQKCEGWANRPKPEQTMAAFFAAIVWTVALGFCTDGLLGSERDADALRVAYEGRTFWLTPLAVTDSSRWAMFHQSVYPEANCEARVEKLFIRQARAQDHGKHTEGYDISVHISLRPVNMARRVRATYKLRTVSELVEADNAIRRILTDVSPAERGELKGGIRTLREVEDTSVEPIIAPRQPDSLEFTTLWRFRILNRLDSVCSGYSDSLLPWLRRDVRFSRLTEFLDDKVKCIYLRQALGLPGFLLAGTQVVHLSPLPGEHGLDEVTHWSSIAIQVATGRILVLRDKARSSSGQSKVMAFSSEANEYLKMMHPLGRGEETVRSAILGDILPSLTFPDRGILLSSPRDFCLFGQSMAKPFDLVPLLTSDSVLEEQHLGFLSGKDVTPELYWTWEVLYTDSCEKDREYRDIDVAPFSMSMDSSSLVVKAMIWNSLNGDLLTWQITANRDNSVTITPTLVRRDYGPSLWIDYGW